jgi:hypothetical protein
MKLPIAREVEIQAMVLACLAGDRQRGLYWIGRLVRSFGRKSSHPKHVPLELMLLQEVSEDPDQVKRRTEFGQDNWMCGPPEVRAGNLCLGGEDGEIKANDQCL